MLHAPSGFDPELVEQTLAALTEHHDALRMVYQKNTPFGWPVVPDV